MFGRDAVTNLSQLTKPKIRYMGTEDLILDLELMSSIFQTQIHNLRMARECIIKGQQPVKKPNINVGDLVLVRDHTSKCFMPKYKVDFRVVCIQGNKVKVKDNNGKLSWYHISDIKKTDMVTKLICQLPDVDAFGRTGRLTFNPEHVKNLGWVTSGTFRVGLCMQYSEQIISKVEASTVNGGTTSKCSATYTSKCSNSPTQSTS